MDPIVVTVPHRHGKTEAARRVKAAVDDARTRYPAKMKIAEENWEGDRLNFRASVLGQTITGTIAIGDADIRAEVTLPWLMAHLVKPTEDLLRTEGERALG